IRDVERPLIRREGETIRPHEIVGDDLDAPVARIDAIDIAALLLLRRLVALIVRQDSVRRVSEPESVVGRLHHGVWGVQPLAGVAVGDDGDPAVRLRASDPARAVLAADKPALAIAGMAVGIVGVGPKDAHSLVGYPAHDAVVGY